MSAQSCPECGSDDETGWSDTTVQDETTDDPFYAGETAAARRSGAFLWPLLLLIPVGASYLGGALWGLTLLAACGLASVFFLFQTRSASRPVRKERDLYENLLRKAGGDEKLVASIIVNEQRRRPQSSRSEAMQSAIYKWERDNK